MSQIKQNNNIMVYIDASLDGRVESTDEFISQIGNPIDIEYGYSTSSLYANRRLGTSKYNESHNRNIICSIKVNAPPLYIGKAVTESHMSRFLTQYLFTKGTDKQFIVSDEFKDLLVKAEDKFVDDIMKGFDYSHPNKILSRLDLCYYYPLKKPDFDRNTRDGDITVAELVERSEYSYSEPERVSTVSVGQIEPFYTAISTARQRFKNFARSFTIWLTKQLELSIKGLQEIPKDWFPIFAGILQSNMEYSLNSSNKNSKVQFNAFIIEEDLFDLSLILQQERPITGNIADVYCALTHMCPPDDFAIRTSLKAEDRHSYWAIMANAGLEGLLKPSAYMTKIDSLNKSIYTVSSPSNYNSYFSKYRKCAYDNDCRDKFRFEIFEKAKEIFGVSTGTALTAILMQPIVQPAALFIEQNIRPIPLIGGTLADRYDDILMLTAIRSVSRIIESRAWNLIEIGNDPIIMPFVQLNSSLLLSEVSRNGAIAIAVEKTAKQVKSRNNNTKSEQNASSNGWRDDYDLEVETANKLSREATDKLNGFRNNSFINKEIVFKNIEQLRVEFALIMDYLASFTSGKTRRGSNNPIDRLETSIWKSRDSIIAREINSNTYVSISDQLAKIVDAYRTIRLSLSKFSASFLELEPMNKAIVNRNSATGMQLIVGKNPNKKFVIESNYETLSHPSSTPRGYFSKPTAQTWEEHLYQFIEKIVLDRLKNDPSYGTVSLKVVRVDKSFFDWIPDQIRPIVIEKFGDYVKLVVDKMADTAEYLLYREINRLSSIPIVMDIYFPNSASKTFVVTRVKTSENKTTNARNDITTSVDEVKENELFKHISRNKGNTDE